MKVKVLMISALLVLNFSILNHAGTSHTLNCACCCKYLQKEMESQSKFGIIINNMLFLGGESCKDQCSGEKGCFQGEYYCNGYFECVEGAVAWEDPGEECDEAYVYCCMPGYEPPDPLHCLEGLCPELDREYDR